MNGCPADKECVSARELETPVGTGATIGEDNMTTSTTAPAEPPTHDTCVLQGHSMELGELDLAYEVEMDDLLRDLRGFERLDAALRETP